jgi:hypothetical protein
LAVYDTWERVQVEDSSEKKSLRQIVQEETVLESFITYRFLVIIAKCHYIILDVELYQLLWYNGYLYH